MIFSVGLPVLISKFGDLRIWGFENLKMWEFEDVEMRGCGLIRT
jgi:hypothetical protein